jgi:hypothetical protein
VVYANGSGAKRTVNVYFPISGILNYASNTIQMSVPLQFGGNKLISSNVTIPVTINNGTVVKGNYNAEVSWATGTSPITVTLSAT